ncbi:MAG: hypothetical protein ACT4NY_01610 [Pseudonocardiales bacterium]
MRVSRPRRRGVVAGVGLAAAVVAATAWMLTQGTRGAELANVLALPVAVAGLLVALVAARSGSESTDQLRLTARRLARDVCGLETGVLARLMADTGDPAPADVSFTQPALIYWRVDGGARRGTLSEVEGYYRSLSCGRLVVLGEPGAGKTVLAIKLVRDLAAAVLATPDDVRPFPPVPVRLSLPSFDPGDVAAATTEVISARLDAWLSQHLVTVFGLSGKVARALVREGRILPVLDGLDEMDIDDTRPLRAAAVIRALNHPSTGGLRPVVITCRTSRYHQLSAAPDATDGDRPAGPEATQRKVVQDATAVGVEPLTVQRVIEYLTYRFPDPTDPARIEYRWRPIIDRLTANNSGDPLVAALSSPLRLFLTVTSYRHDASRPNNLTNLDTADQIDNHLFTQLVPAVLTQHPATGREYTAATVTRWLTTLARHLTWQGEHGGSPSDLWLHLLWPAAGERAPRYTAAALMTTSVTILYLIIFGLIVYVGAWDSIWLAFVVTGATIVVVVAWRASQCAVDLRRLDLRDLRTSAGRRRIRQFFVSGSKLGFKVGFILGFLLFFVLIISEEGVAISLAGGVIVGVLFGFAFGLVGGLVGALGAHPPFIDHPSRLVRQGLVHLATVTVVFGLVIGFLAGFVASSAYGNWLEFGIVFALLFGFPVGFMFAANSPWPRYIFATRTLARRGDLPRRPAVFLDWAYDAGLMRLAGISVQFRHREFQTWLITRSQLFDDHATTISNTGLAGTDGTQR